jgi:hypothetical protein
MQTDGPYYGASLQSNVFELVGGTGEWSAVQLQGYALWGADGIPCSSYSCVRNCSNVESEETSNIPENGNSTYNDCANSCPDVYIDPSSTRGGQPTATLTMPTSCSSKPRRHQHLAKQEVTLVQPALRLAPYLTLLI